MLAGNRLAVTIAALGSTALVLLSIYSIMYARGEDFYSTLNLARNNDRQKSTTRGHAHKPAHSWTWTDLFSYVPFAIEECKTLFNGSGEYTPKFTSEYNEFLEKIKTVKVTEGTSADYKEEFMAYIESVQAPFVRTVCETGFNAGHSTFAWLATNPVARVYSFDMGSHTYARPMSQYLMDRFPGRLNVTWGNSAETLPKFREEHPDIKCDLMVIDGGHTYDICNSDLQNFRQMANPDNILILDNYPDKRWGFLAKLGRCWEDAKMNAEIVEIYKCHYNQFRQGFSLARIIVN